MRKTLTAVWLVLLAALLAGYAFGDARRIPSGGAYLPGPETLQRLEHLDPSPKGDVLEFGGGSVRRRHGNIVLHLKGTPYEMGYQHGPAGSRSTLRRLPHDGGRERGVSYEPVAMCSAAM